jgi:hypothetical protein
MIEVASIKMASIMQASMPFLVVQQIRLKDGWPAEELPNHSPRYKQKRQRAPKEKYVATFALFVRILPGRIAPLGW